MAGITVENDTIYWVDDTGDAFEVLRDEDGDYVFEHQDGSYYVVNDAITAAAEAEQTQYQPEYEYEEAQQSPDWVEPHLHYLATQEREQNRVITPTERKRYADAVVENDGNIPPDKSWAYDLTDANQRTDFMYERAIKDAPDPHGQNIEPVQTDEEVE